MLDDRIEKDPNPNKCLCGCGQELIQTNKQHIKKYIHGHNSRINNGNWKGGIYIDKRDGYKMIRLPNHPLVKHSNFKYYEYHRYVYEQYYNCILLPRVILHHKDGNKLNNSIENLEPMYRDKHLLIHNPLFYRWGKISATIDI